MHDIKFIRKDPELFADKMLKRNKNAIGRNSGQKFRCDQKSESKI